MTTTTISGRQVLLDDEGFIVNHQEWDEALGKEFARQIGIELTEEHWKVIRFAREDFEREGETPTLRRLQVAGGVSTKEMFALFPKKPAKKMAYVAGLPKPAGCV